MVSVNFPLLLDNEWRKQAHHKCSFSRKEDAVFWDTLPRSVRISMKKQRSRRARFIIFLQILVIIINSKLLKNNNPGFIVWPICTTLPIRHSRCYSDFFRQMSNIWSGPMSRGRLLKIWYRTKFYQTVVLAHEQVSLWSGPKVLVP